MEVRWFCKSDQLPRQSTSAVQVHEAHDRELFATTLTSINPISSIAGRAQVLYRACVRVLAYGYAQKYDLETKESQDISSSNLTLVQLDARVSGDLGSRRCEKF